MKKQLVSFDTAKLAKEKGFDWVTIYYRQKSAVIGDETILPLDKDSKGEDWNNFSSQVPYYSIPTQSLLQKWLREVHGVIVWVNPTYYDRWLYTVDVSLPNGYHDIFEGTTWEEALETGLLEALKLIKNEVSA